MSTSVAVPGVRYWFDQTLGQMGGFTAPGRPILYIKPPSAPWDYSETNLPWAYTSTNDWKSLVPAGADVRPLSNVGATFRERLNNTLTDGVRSIVELPEGDFRLLSFVEAVPANNDPLYSFGYYNRNLAGFIGQGPDKTFVTMAAGSMSQLQLDTMKRPSKLKFEPLQMGMMRFDGSIAKGNNVFLGGLTFRAEDQPNVTELNADVTGIFLPQPAPHQGIVIYSRAEVLMSHVRFQAAGRALMGQPPFEMSNFTTQYSRVTIRRCEFDGRRSADLDPFTPRRCNPIMLNNETLHDMEYVYLHDGNVSRYAANDENAETQGLYSVRKFKIERISNNFNTDPRLNNGERLGGWSPVTPFGWESSKANIILEDGFIEQTINETRNGQVPAHFQMTVVGSTEPVNPQGGRFRMERVKTTYTGWPEFDGFIIGRIGKASYWRSDGYETTLQVYHPETGVRLAAFELPDAWPPRLGDLTAAGVRPETHYLIKLA